MYLDMPNACSNCGSTKLSFTVANEVPDYLMQGRLRSNEVQPYFYLGCTECGETLGRMHADRAAAVLNEVKPWDSTREWRPDVLREAIRWLGVPFKEIIAAAAVAVGSEKTDGMQKDEADSVETTDC